MRKLGWEAQRARHLRVRFDDHDAIGVRRGAVQLAHGRARVQRQAHVAVRIGRRRGRRHQARRELFGHCREPPEVGGQVLDVRAVFDQQTLRRSEEATEVAHARLREQRIQIEQEPAEHFELDPVVAPTERVQQGGGRARAEGRGHRVGRANERGRLLDAHLASGHSR